MRPNGGDQLVFIGAGGHAHALWDLCRSGDRIKALVTPISAPCHLASLAKTIFSDDDDVQFEHFSDCMVLIGVGWNGGRNLRYDLFQRYRDKGFSIASRMSSSASISRSVTLGEGVQIFPSAVIGSNVSIGDNVILNSGSIVEHNSYIGPHVHIGPGAIVCGSVVVEENAFIGAGAIVTPGVIIPSGTFIRAGHVSR